jgi:hypothetical protein
LNRACNDYCANDSECGGGLKCWWNRCRLAKNLEDTSCRAPAAKRVVTYQAPSSTNYVTVGTGVAEAACNEACTSNRDCAANLRCYQGTCRLPDNVTSTRCSLVTSEPTGTAVAPVISPTVEPTFMPVVTPAAETQNMTALEDIGQWLAGRLGFLIVGLVIAVIVILVWPMLRTGFVPAQTARPMAPLPPRQVPPVPQTQPPVSAAPPVNQSVSRMMAPPAPPATPVQSPPNQPPRAV